MPQTLSPSRETKQGVRQRLGAQRLAALPSCLPRGFARPKRSHLPALLQSLGEGPRTTMAGTAIKMTMASTVKNICDFTKHKTPTGSCPVAQELFVHSRHQFAAILEFGPQVVESEVSWHEKMITKDH